MTRFANNIIPRIGVLLDASVRTFCQRFDQTAYCIVLYINQSSLFNTNAILRVSRIYVKNDCVVYNVCCKLKYLDGGKYSHFTYLNYEHEMTVLCEYK